MEIITTLIELFLHLDEYLAEIITQYGTWTYALNNAHAAVQAMDVGETLTDTHTFTASDGSTRAVTVTIDGAEDATVISGQTTGAVAQDGQPAQDRRDGRAQLVGGLLGHTDPDVVLFGALQVADLPADVAQLPVDDEIGGEHVDQIRHQRFQFGPRDLDVHVFGATGIGRDKGQVDLGLHRGGQLHFGFFRRLFKALEGHFIGSDVDALLFTEGVGQIVDQAQIKIFSTQVGVAIGRFYFTNTLPDSQNRYIKGAAAKIKNQNHFVLVRLLINAVGDGGRGRFIDDPPDIQPGDFAGIPRRLPLGVGEELEAGA